MPQQTPGQTRVADPILSQHARGYRQQNMVAEALFPRVNVAAYGGQIIEFGKESFRLYNSKRAAGSATKRITYGYAGKPYAIVPGALEALVPREQLRDASQVPGINLASGATNKTMRSMLLEHEVASANLARDANNYAAANKVTLVGAARWTDATSKPSTDIKNGKIAIADSVGLDPNVVLLSKLAFNALEFHPEILDRVKYTSSDAVTEQLLAKLWNVDRVVVGKAKVATGQDDAFGDVWGADVVLAYASLGADVDANIDEPSYGYTYVIDGMPLVEPPYWDANHKSWVYGVSYDNAPVISGMQAGYLIKDAGL